ncbi:MAG: sulfite exporter TauE/SafE family protein [Gemmatimonadota bacterium]|nr:sulfite exporter TauE/SafE family protein [Gemmatimonadota bacterium]
MAILNPADVPELSALRLALVALAAAGGGLVNAIAGGGTLLTFPALVALGVPPLIANATSTVALWPGTLTSFWSYRDALRGARAWTVRWALPSVLGGISGAVLLLWTPERRFADSVPWLIWGATALFMLQGPVMRWVAGHAKPARDGAELAPPRTGFLFYQFFVAVYGGYFGAGAGILMLAALGMMGLTNIHTMNGLKNWGGLNINLVAVFIFAISGIVHWPIALTMAIGAAAGGMLGARLAQRVGQRWVRRAIIAIGLGSGAYTLILQMK